MILQNLIYSSLWLFRKHILDFTLSLFFNLKEPNSSRQRYATILKTAHYCFLWKSPRTLPSVNNLKRTVDSVLWFPNKTSVCTHLWHQNNFIVFMVPLNLTKLKPTFISFLYNLYVRFQFVHIICLISLIYSYVLFDCFVYAS